MIVIERHEIIALSGYLEGGGLRGNNVNTVNYADQITRGGKDLFMWALDANVTPAAWDDFKFNDVCWLDNMNAEII